MFYCFDLEVALDMAVLKRTKTESRNLVLLADFPWSLRIARLERSHLNPAFGLFLIQIWRQFPDSGRMRRLASPRPSPIQHHAREERHHYFCAMQRTLSVSNEDFPVWRSAKCTQLKNCFRKWKNMRRNKKELSRDSSTIQSCLNR